MTIDIAKLYAKVKQRAERDRGTESEELGATARALAKEVLIKQTLASVQRFAAAERKWLRSRERGLEPVAPDFVFAFKSKDFVCNYRTVNNFNTGHDPEAGWIYLLESPVRPDQVKIGYTTNDLRRRLLRIRRLHEPSAVLFWARWVKYPSRLESLLHSEFRASRVAGNINGDSIEWYSVRVEVVEKMIIRMLRPGLTHWAGEIIFSCDPEAKIIHT